jgi:16S rRNA (guanine1516-N2)-methyltransferase
MGADSIAVVTTAGKHAELLSPYAEKLAVENCFLYIPRKKKSINSLLEDYKKPVLVVSKTKLELYSAVNEAPFFYHPNAASLRIKQFLKTGHDPLISAAGVKQGDQIVDATLGLGADSLLLACAAGSTGKVTGVESSQLISLIVREGLRAYSMPVPEMETAAARITVEHKKSEEYLSSLETNSVDLVLFDPMFTGAVSGSSGLSAMRHFVNNNGLSSYLLEEACRVSRRKVLLKDYSRSTVFKRYGFTLTSRSSANYQIGYIDSKERKI